MLRFKRQSSKPLVTAPDSVKPVGTSTFHKQPEPEIKGRICICTPDYVHLVKNGGIGTAFHHLALVLVGRGFDVTIVYASRTEHISLTDRQAALAAVEAEGCRLEFLFDDATSSIEKALYPNDIYTMGSYLAYKALTSSYYHTIIFADWRGLAYYSVHAKRQGLAFRQTKLWVQGHSSTLWHELHNHADHFDQLDIRAFHFERRSIELCDKFVPASAYLETWNLAHGFVHPVDTEVLPLVINEDLLRDAPSFDIGSAEKRVAREIVFFGRLEQRKGLQLFLQAIQRLYSRHADVVAEHELSFTFLGKITQINGTNSVEYIEQQLVNLPVRYSILVSLSSHEAVRYLASRPTLAVIASLADNSPMTVHECIYAKVPFIASNAGGIAEIVHPDDQDILFRPFPNTLADAIVATLGRPVRSVRARINQLDDNIPRWLELLRAKEQTGPERAAPTELVSVCLTHFDRPDYLSQTLKGLEAQTYKNFEVIIVDNGSTSPEAIEYLAALDKHHPSLTTRRFDLPDLYPGAARNLAIEKALGEYILIMDDDNYAHSRQIELFLKAAVTSGFDALTCAAVLFPEDVECPNANSDFFYMYLPSGSGISLNLFNNLYGDANGFFRKSAVQAVGGYTEERSSWEDYELYAALELGGFKTAVVPEPLMYLRETTGSVSRTGSMLGNYYRALRPAFRHFPWKTFGDALLISLNDTLRSVSNANYGVSAESSDARIARESNDPIVVNRLLLRRALSNGRVVDGMEQLQALVGASSQLEVLGWDLYLLASACNRLDLWRASRPSNEVSDIVRAFGNANKRDNFDALAKLLESLDRSEPDFLYLQGLALLLAGSPIEAFKAWARMLDVPDALYLQRNQDVSQSIERKYFRRAYGHYIRNGVTEKRPFSYTPPVKAPFAAIGAEPYRGYLDDVGLLFGASFRETSARLSTLLLRLIATGSVIEIADLAENMLALAEALYVDHHRDVQEAISDGSWTSDGLTHWLMEGRSEERTHLIGSLPDYTATKDSIVPATDVSPAAMQRGSIGASPLADWLRIES